MAMSHMARGGKVAGILVIGFGVAVGFAIVAGFKMLYNLVKPKPAA